MYHTLERSVAKVEQKKNVPRHIEIRGAKVHNLKNIDVDIPLNQIVGIAGVSGGEAQRLKLVSEMGKGQSDSVFVFDEPTIGLHPLDVRTLLAVFQELINQGATVIVIEHDLDVIRSADYIIDMGPGCGGQGGEIVAAGSVEDIKSSEQSITGKYLQ